MPNFQWQKGGSKDGKPGYILSFPYDAEIVEKLKAKIPNSMREWRSEEKQWWVSEYCQLAINELFPGFLEAVQAQHPLLSDKEAEELKKLWD